MFEQYLRFKEENPDCLLFFRMGDFYELFFEDAEIVSRAVQIAMTSRNPKDEAPVPMCGVPNHAVEPYLSQLLEKGYKIALCDQIVSDGAVPWTIGIESGGATGWPATMEGAVISGRMAASSVLQQERLPPLEIADGLPRAWLARLLIKP